MFAFSVSANAQDFGFENEDDDPYDEITTYGTRGDAWPGDNLGWFAGFWEFRVVDIGDVYGTVAPFIGLLNDSLVVLNEASEELCEVKIEDWRSDCHHQMNVAGALCSLTGVFATGAAVQTLLPSFLRTAVGSVSVTVGSIGCYGYTGRAHAICDDIANSERAKDVAVCD